MDNFRHKIQAFSIGLFTAVMVLGSSSAYADPDIVGDFNIDARIVDNSGGTSDGVLDWGVTPYADRDSPDGGTDCVIDERPFGGTCEGKPNHLLILDPVSSQTDDTLTQGSKEDCPRQNTPGCNASEEWVYTTGKAPPKTDLEQALLWKDELAVDDNNDGKDDTAVYIGGTTFSNNGATNYSIEFVSSITEGSTLDPCLDDGSNGGVANDGILDCLNPLPLRTEGNFVFWIDQEPTTKSGTTIKSFTFRGFVVKPDGTIDIDNPDLEAQIVNDPAAIPNTGDLADGEDISDQLGAVCDTDGDDIFDDICPLGTLTVGVNNTQIPAGIWGPNELVDPQNNYEVAINLDPLGLGPSCPGVGFVYTKTRASGSSGSPALKDITRPHVFDLNTCGKIIIVKDSLGGTGTFKYDTDIVSADGTTFSGNGGSAGDDFSIDTSTTNPNEFVIQQVDPDDGPFFVTELNPQNDPGGFKFKTLTCIDSDTGGTDSTWSGATATINLDRLETVTCTYTNEAYGTIIIDKETTGADPASGLLIGTFNFNSDAHDDLDDSITTDTNGDGDSYQVDLPPGSYDVSELDPTGDNFVLTGISCSDTDNTSTTIASGGAGGTANIGLDAGETVTCTFTNFKVLPDIEINKSCDSSEIVNDGTEVQYFISGNGGNTGNVKLVNVNVYDDPALSNFKVYLCEGTTQCGNDGALQGGSFALEPGQRFFYEGDKTLAETTLPNTAHVESDSDLLAIETDDSFELACSQTIDPDGFIEKECANQLFGATLAGGQSVVAIQTNISGQICNDGDVQMTIQQLSDNPEAVISYDFEEGQDNILDPDECVLYTGYYVPTDASTIDPASASFSDQITATVSFALGGGGRDLTADASCDLCVFEE